MPLNRSDPNYYSAPVTCPTTTGVSAVGFGFPATFLRLMNTNAVDIYASLQSSSAASTADLRVRACSELVLAGVPPVSVLTAYSTSTGTSPVLNVTAMA